MGSKTINLDIDSRFLVEAERAKCYGQEHLFRFWDELDSLQKDILLRCSERIDYAFISSLYYRCLNSKPAAMTLDNLQKPDLINKYPYLESHTAASISAIDAIKKGELALFVVAGGQGSRLGFDGPKGLYPATSIIHKSLFEVFAEKILAAQEKYFVKLHWYIMTSADNNSATITFFEKNNYFGLDLDKVHFFIQLGSFPAVDMAGKIIMKSKFEVFFNPNGTAGIYDSLVENGMIDNMKIHGIKYLSFFNVDNPLVNIVDPLFLGYHINSGSEFSVKAIERRNSSEPIGVVVKYSGKHSILEYVNIPKNVSELKDTSGNLFFNYGSINILMFSVDYIQMVYERKLVDFSAAALKKVPYLDETGVLIHPEKPNAYKFEGFVFDPMPYAKNCFTLGILREEEFAPIKNAHGEDSPGTCYSMQTTLYKKWLINSGVSSSIVNNLQRIEVSSLFAIDFDEFKGKISKELSKYESLLKDVDEFYFG